MKFVNTLRNMSWRWFFRYYRKRARIMWHLYCSAALGRTYWEVAIDGVTVQLYWHTPYHHEYARNFALNRHEPELIKKWRHEAAHAKVVIDAGAYNGIYGLVAAKANPAAKVFIVEPDPVNAAHIRRNIETNGLTNATLVQKALSGHVGTTRFTHDRGGSAGKIANEGAVVETTTLAHLGEPDLIKLDVVGAEYDALVAARGLLMRKDIAIFLELYPHNKEKLLPYLQSLGYQAHFLYPRSDGGVEYYFVSKS